MPAHVQTGGTIKVGILYSLSSTMAIFETVLKDTVLMAIDEVNATGGVMGEQLEPVIVGSCVQLAAFCWKKPSGC